MAARFPLALLIAIGVSSSAAGAMAAEKLSINGSSTVRPITEAAIKGFKQTAKGKNVTIELKESGTSGGFRLFCAEKISISNASRPINAKELKLCEKNGVRFIELPIAFDAITVVVNPANSWAKDITVQELKRLWSKDAQDKVKRWSQVNPSWPDKAVNLYGPGKDSGTFDYFNKAVNGDSENSRIDYTSSENDDVIVKGVATDPLALGYFGFEYYQANKAKLRALALEQADGTKVLPTLKAVQDESYRPLSRPLFIYVNDKQLQSSASLRDFVGYSLSNGYKLAEEAGAIPLISSTYRLIESKVYRRALGSAYAGSLPVGLTLKDILNRSLDQDKRPEFRN
ncbi:MAG: ABC-type phosphate transport system, substrate binding protein [Cyanobacteriota bacterium]